MGDGKSAHHLPTAKNLVWNKSSPHSSEKLKEPLRLASPP